MLTVEATIMMNKEMIHYVPSSNRTNYKIMAYA